MGKFLWEESGFWEKREREKREQETQGQGGLRIWPWVLGGLVLLWLLGTVIGALQDSPSSQKEAIAPPKEPATVTQTQKVSPASREAVAAPLEILSWQLRRDEWSVWVEGRALNTSSRTLAYAEVRAYFYNDWDDRIGDFFDNTSDLSPWQVWQFHIPYVGRWRKNEVKRAEVRVGTYRFK